jgi:hypothetical protein
VAELHPEVEKEIEAGPQLVPRSKAMATKLFTHTQESPQEFARRIAALAVEKEREALRDAFVDELMEADATWSRGEAMDVSQQAIRRRGKP